MMQLRILSLISLLILGLSIFACDGGSTGGDEDVAGAYDDIPVIWDQDIKGVGEPGDPDVVFGTGDTPDGGDAEEPSSLLCTPDPCDAGANEACDPETGDCVCAADACDIDGECHPDGLTAPGNNCLVCDVEAAADDWTPADGVFCNDDDLCTTGDECLGGVCTGAALDCDDGNHCSTDVCDPVDGCSHSDNDLPCDDGNLCTSSDTCSGGVCFGSNMSCDDANACTADSCDLEIGCLNDAIDCSDGDACTVDSCDPAEGCLTAPLVCDDGDACTSDGCDPGAGCVNVEVDCNDFNACTSDGCDPGLGCVNVEMDCDDGDPCTEDACTPVSGCLHAALDCSDGDPCTVDSCDPDQGCVHAAMDCDDGDACTLDSCAAGQGCIYAPLDCDDADLCTEDSCQPAIGCVYAVTSCDDELPCTIDSCDPVLGCQHTSAVEICDGLDNDCNGQIDDLPAAAPTVWFSETFASNGQVWTADPTWAIGATSLSSGEGYGGPDPEHDFTDTSDDGVGGVVLGGNTGTDLHGFYYLTSPIINVGAAPGEVHLGYRRWLNSDYSPYMTNVVEVFDGAVWHVIWQSGSSPGVQDSEWIKVNHDLTAYKNANLRVRFGYSIDSAGVFVISGWNVDDVVVSDHPDLDVVLFEDFGAPGLGWSLGQDWAIGATAASSGQNYGNPDPAQDASPSGDNGVAGVVLGGNPPKDLHDWYWLTSPARDTSAYGSTYLVYQRWLNSDYLPFMANRIEAWDGAAWQVVWESAGSPGIQDAAWTPQVHDLTPFKNAALQVRFGFKIENSGVYFVSSWNLDDVAIIEGLPGCP